MYVYGLRSFLPSVKFSVCLRILWSSFCVVILSFIWCRRALELKHCGLTKEIVNVVNRLKPRGSHFSASNKFLFVFHSFCFCEVWLKLYEDSLDVTVAFVAIIWAFLAWKLTEWTRNNMDCWGPSSLAKLTFLTPGKRFCLYAQLTSVKKLLIA